MSLDVIFRIVELIGALILSLIGLKIKDAISGVKQELMSVKEELVANQNKMLLDFNNKHSENKATLAVHIAEDRVEFRAIEKNQHEVKQTLREIQQKIEDIS